MGFADFSIQNQQPIRYHTLPRTDAITLLSKTLLSTTLFSTTLCLPNKFCLPTTSSHLIWNQNQNYFSFKKLSIQDRQRSQSKFCWITAQYWSEFRLNRSNLQIQKSSQSPRQSRLNKANSLKFGDQVLVIFQPRQRQYNRMLTGNLGSSSGKVCVIVVVIFARYGK